MSMSVSKGLCALVAAGVLTVFGKYEPAVEWIYRSGVGTSVTNMASYFDADNWDGGEAPNSPAVSAKFPSLSDVRYVRFDRDITLGGAQALGPVSEHGLAASPRLILVSDANTLDTCASVGGSSYPVDGIDLYADHNHADWSYFTSLNLAGDTLCPGQLTLAWGAFVHRLDWYAKASGGARTNALAASILYQGSGCISLIAPESSATAVTGQWSGTAGSRFLHRVGADHVLPSGTLVHGAGIPEGTFLKRVFTRSDIELSQPLTADLDGDVTFDAQTARVYQHFDRHDLQGSNHPWFRASKYRAEDDFVVDIGIVNHNHGSHYAVYDSESSMHPATFVIHDATRVKHLSVGNTHLVLAEAGTGLANGFPIADAVLKGSTGETLFTVNEGLSASIYAITNLQHTLAKDGAGILSLGFRNDGIVNHGGVAVREGTLVVSNLLAGTQAVVGALNVAAGATLRVEGEFLCSSLAVAPDGSLVVPAGARLVVSGGSLEDLPAFEGEGEIVCASATGRNDPPLYETPVVEVAGTPAFWVDACSLTNASPAGVLETVDGTTYVSRWNDCRSPAEGGEHFATNRWSCPCLVTGGANGPYVKIGGCNATDESLLCALVWDRPITNIRHVFYVFDPTDGGGTILGNTQGVSPDFLRGGVSRNNDIIYSGGPNANVVGATVYLDCVKTNRMAKLSSAAVPTVLELPLAGNAAANAFGTIFFGSLRKDLAGNARIHEYVIYTNELTHAERVATLSYLFKKWKNGRDVAFSTFPDGENLGTVALKGNRTGLSVGAGEAAGVGGLNGSGTFVKSGAGEAYLTDAMNANANLVVAEGTLHVRSCAIPLDNPVGDTYLHLDASKTNTLVWSRIDGIDRISKWSDTENGRDLTPHSNTSTNLPRVRLEALNGLAMVDFGPAMGSRNSYPKDHASLKFTGTSNLQTIFSVLDTAGGGGALLGGSNGRNDSPASKYVGLWRDVQSWPDWYQQPLIMGTKARTIDGRNLNASIYSGDFVDMSKTEVRLNQEVVDQANTGFTGGFDMFSVRSTTKMTSDLLGGIHYGYSFGGMSYGEVIYYERYLNADEVRRVERYLAYKWFNRTQPMWRPAELGDVTVAAGAVLQVEGDTPLTVRGLAGAGTVSGDVAVAVGGELVVEAVNGSIVPITVTGSLSLPDTGTLRVTGDVGSLEPGRYAILAGAGVTAGSLGGWSVVAPARPVRVFRLLTENGALKLDVFARGTVLSFR